MIRIKRKKLINKNALIVVFGSLFMSVTINLIQIINVMIETKAVGIGTIINAFIETNYIPIHFLLCIFYWICFGCIGFLYLFVYYKTLRKWSAIVITIALVVLSYGLYSFFQIAILFLDYYDFSKLFDYRGFILPIPYLDCAWSILKYGVLMYFGYYLGKNIYEKRCVENCGLRRMVTSLRQLSYVLICMVQEALACLNIFILAFHFRTFQFFTCFTSAVWYYLPSVFFMIFVPILKMTLFIQLLEIRIERRFI